MKNVLLIALFLFVNVPGLRAQDVQVYGGGMVSFDFHQFPFGGPLTGSFRAQGQILDPSTFPPGQPGAASGFLAQSDPSSMLGVFGGFLNADSELSADLMFIVLRDDEPIAPGRYRIEPQNENISIGFIDNGRSIDLPDNFNDLISFDWRDWFLRISADHRFIGVYGTITVTAVQDASISGTFEGLMVDVENQALMISVSDGSFDLAPILVSVDETTWGTVKGLYRE